MNIVEIQTSKVTDRGSAVGNYRFVTEIKDYETIRKLVLDKYKVTTLEELNAFGEQITDITIEEYPEELLEI